MVLANSGARAVERADRRRLLIGGLACATTTIAATQPAAALDCEYERCLNAALLPGSSVDWGDLIRRLKRFYGVSTNTYIVSFSRVAAKLPYLQRAIDPIPEQIHIPEIYHATIEAQHIGERHFVWHYILGHEYAHAYQESVGLIDAWKVYDRRHLPFELHADFLSGFFLASEYGMEMKAIDQIMAEVTALPAGEPEDDNYHGTPWQRWWMATQGALLALQRPRPRLGAASAEGINRIGEVLPADQVVR